MDLLSQTISIILLILGFGFVVFFHELGHFLAAKWVGIKVDQFAVGFGHAILSWRPGLGVRWGSSVKELEAKQQQAADAGRYGETEYRINWIPLGGYVKMLGQDDLRPGADADDPRAFNKKSVGARMLVVSAGVIMNVILAAIGFMIVFLAGFKAPPAIVGTIIPGSPAQNAVNAAGQRAPLRVGDKILLYAGRPQHDFTKIALNAALSGADERQPLDVLHRDGQRERVYVVPAAPKNESRAFMTLGIGRPPQILRGLDTDQKLTDEALSPEVSPPELTAIKPGDSIVAVNGQPVQASDYAVFDEALQRSGGKPVHLTVQDATGQTRTVQVPPHFMEPFDSDLNFAGMVPRAAIHALMGRTTVKGKLRPGDAIVSVTSAGDVLTNPTRDQFREWVGKAGEQGRSVGITVLRDGKTISFDDIGTDARVAQGQRGLGVQLTGDEKVPVVAATLDNSPAKAVGIPIGSTIKSINDQPVASWFDVQTALSAAQPDQAIRILVEMPDGKAQKTYAMTLSDSQLTVIRQNRYEAWVILREMEGLRQTHNPIVAAWWGVTETRDFILQFYLTIQRMFQGTVSIRNMMGPVGIVTAGAHFAFKGIAWLIWFLAMISANLAVVNFLPIPVVDGGLFTFLILEKLQGKPLSHRTQSIAQVVGLALILGVFLLVTYQDIIRLIP